MAVKFTVGFTLASERGGHRHGAALETLPRVGALPTLAGTLATPLEVWNHRIEKASGEKLEKLTMPNVEDDEHPGNGESERSDTDQCGTETSETERKGAMH
eukprot:GHVT01094565.1.p1 GENE.GHVT01094565.1~~GHVT01094565.1.p1  ORF type:complete len:101 (+),score=14.03 GHVT01094565.1:264-566(+)